MLQTYFHTRSNKNIPSHLPQFGAPDGDTTDEELFFITKYVTAIDKVFLRNSFVTEEGLQLLKKLQKVNYLDLRGMPLHDGNLDCILHFESLEYLDVQYTRLSPQGIGQVLNTFRGLRTLLAQVGPEDASLPGVWEAAFPHCDLMVGITGSS